MRFPDNLASQINENASDKLLEITMINGDTKKVDSNLKSWTVTKVSSTQIDINLIFEKPLLVSTGEFPDILLIQVLLSTYTDINSKSLPPAVVK